MRLDRYPASPRDPGLWLSWSNTKSLFPSSTPAVAFVPNRSIKLIRFICQGTTRVSCIDNHVHFFHSYVFNNEYSMWIETAFWQPSNIFTSLNSRQKVLAISHSLVNSRGKKLYRFLALQCFAETKPSIGPLYNCVADHLQVRTYDGPFTDLISAAHVMSMWPNMGCVKQLQSLHQICHQNDNSALCRWTEKHLALFSFKLLVVWVFTICSITWRINPILYVGTFTVINQRRAYMMYISFVFTNGYTKKKKEV